MNIPQDVDQYGFCKTLLVRREVIHIKHIMTEIFTRNSIIKTFKYENSKIVNFYTENKVKLLKTS